MDPRDMPAAKGLVPPAVHRPAQGQAGGRPPPRAWLLTPHPAWRCREWSSPGQDGRHAAEPSTDQETALMTRQDRGGPGRQKRQPEQEDDTSGAQRLR